VVQMSNPPPLVPRKKSRTLTIHNDDGPTDYEVIDVLGSGEQATIYRAANGGLAAIRVSETVIGELLDPDVNARKTKELERQVRALQLASASNIDIFPEYIMSGRVKESSGAEKVAVVMSIEEGNTLEQK
jgi:hypothetical protein